MPKKSTIPTQGSKPIFISHAAADKKIADAVVDLLGLAMEIKVTEEVFCSSAYGCGIPPGEDFKQFIKKHIQQPKIVLIIATQNYAVSPFCWAEAGACWAMSHLAIPIVVPPIRKSELAAVLSGMQAGTITDPEYWNDIFDKFEEVLGTRTKRNRWEQKRDEIIEEFKELIDKQIPPETVSLDKYKKLNEKLNEANSDLKEAHERVKTLNTTINDLKKLKDATKVAEVEFNNLEESEQFESLVGDVKKTFRAIPSICEEALFLHLSGKNLKWGGFGEEGKNNEIEAAIEKEHLISEEDQGACINEDDPKMSRALDALNELSRFITRSSREFKETYTDKHDHQASITSKQFWDEQFY